VRVRGERRKGRGRGREREGEGRGAHLGVQIRRSPSPNPRAQQGRERDGGEEVATWENQMREREIKDGEHMGRGRAPEVHGPEPG
jgi:hypothetical protein